MDKLFEIKRRACRQFLAELTEEQLREVHRDIRIVQMYRRNQRKNYAERDQFIELMRSQFPKA